MKAMMTRARIRAALVGVLAAVLAATAGSAPALAQEPGSAFTQQARSAGLSAAQATELQKAIDKHFAVNPGGVQTAANRVDFPGGTLLVALPGEKTARDLPGTDQVMPAAAASCAYYYACFWSGENYTGSVYRLYYCGQWTTIPWVSEGSWINNQTSGTRIGIDPMTGGPYYSFPAYNAVAQNVYWQNIHRVSAC